jgi:hypothetical protein
MRQKSPNHLRTIKQYALNVSQPSGARFGDGHLAPCKLTRRVTVTGFPGVAPVTVAFPHQSHRTNGRARSDGSSIRPSRGCPGCWAAGRNAQDNARAGHSARRRTLAQRHGPYAGAAPGRARSESHILPRAKSAMRAGANPQELRKVLKHPRRVCAARLRSVHRLTRGIK